MVEADVMFLHLLVKGNIAMKKIDTFLQKIWLDCCGHMSNFNHKDFNPDYALEKHPLPNANINNTLERFIIFHVG